MTDPNQTQQPSRTPSQIMADFDRAALGVADIDMHAVLWEMLDDARSSWRLALAAQGHLTPEQINDADATVTDYLANHYG